MTEHTTLPPGHIIQNRYQIDAAFASGGQADVYRAHQLGLERKVAIKVLKTHGTTEVQARTAIRFEQEAKLISKLRDPHTITLYDFGKLEDGALFMVFEYIDGISLKELVAKQGNVEPYRVAKILKQTLSSLHEAHSMGILHRDLKPANIMIYEHAGKKDLVKLLDFGIAKILHEDETSTISNPNLTGDRIIGTPRYIAPELLLKEKPSASSDLYSLGLVAYELLMGTPAITAHAPLQIVAKQIDASDFILPATANVPRKLADIIHKMLRKDPAVRYQDVMDVSLDLKRWMRQSVPPGSPQESEVFDDLTPPDDIGAMKEYSKRSRSKSGLHVVVPEKLQQTPDLTPRTAFSQSVVFQGRPSVKQVDTLIHKSLNEEHRAITSTQLSGKSHTVTRQSQAIPSQHTAPIQVADTLTREPPRVHPEGRRGGDTIAMHEPVRAHSAGHPRHRPDDQKVAILVIVILMVVILVICVIFAFLLMSP